MVQPVAKVVQLGEPFFGAILQMKKRAIAFCLILTLAWLTTAALDSGRVFAAVSEKTFDNKSPKITFQRRALITGSGTVSRGYILNPKNVKLRGSLVALDPSRHRESSDHAFARYQFISVRQSLQPLFLFFQTFLI